MTQNPTTEAGMTRWYCGNGHDRGLIANNAAFSILPCATCGDAMWVTPRPEARATAPAGRPERWVQTQWGPSEDHLHYLSHVSKWGPGLQDYGDGCRATITVENNDIDGGQFVRVVVHSIAQARATAPAGTPHHRQGLWDQWTGGERLAYGLGLTDGRAEAPVTAPAGLDVENLSRAEDGRLHCRGCDGHDIDFAARPASGETEQDR